MNILHNKPAAVLAVVAGCALPASAQNFPSKPVRIVVPYAAGGPVDTVARVVGQNLTAKWGQQVVVDNRAGSGGALGAHSVVKSPPDGYTLLVTNAGPITSYPHMRKSVLFDFEKDLTLGVSTPEPNAALPEVPPIAKHYPGFEITSWTGVYGPAGMPKAVVDQLYRDVTAAVSVPESKQRLNELGLDLVHGTPADMADFARSESRLFAKLMSAAGIEKE